ncbi:MAG: molybdopterin guanine dinucleotide-containing S/N-oxide reductase [Pseudomonadota bacterium]
MSDHQHTSKHRQASPWGAFSAVVRDGRVVDVEPFEKDPNPSDLIRAVPDAVHSQSRIAQPMVRAGWLDNPPGSGGGGNGDGRGREPFVPVSWDTAFDLVASELERVKSAHGNESIFGGSYGWASAGRFHHAKSQLKRFLNLLGGFTDQTGTYSNAAGHVILPHVTGDRTIARGPYTSWDSITEHTDLFVSFGGLGLKNTQVEPGGMGEHSISAWLPRLRDAKVDVVSITPVEDDTASYLNAQWLSPRPCTDVALMLAIAHTLVSESLHDQDYLHRYCTGFDQFLNYLLGKTDGEAKSAEWAAPICALPADTIRDLARRMAGGTTMIGVAYSLQRAEHGEQAYWMAITLAAMLGQIGKPGGGFGCGYGSMHGYGNPTERFALPTLSTASNPTNSVIPVARIADMLLNPGAPYQFNGKDLRYPDIRLVYWCGGNPFHHHQDLNRLVQAWQRPETIVVNEIWWTATARQADIVLPATTTLERNDIGASSRDRFVLAMHQAVEPVGDAKSDYDIFTGLATRLNLVDAFTEGRDEAEWLRHLYEVARQQAAKKQWEWPDFETFWAQGYIETPVPSEPYILFEDFYREPDSFPLQTPSGKLEIFSDTIASYEYDDCPGHPAWMEPEEWLGGKRTEQFPLHMVSNQPKARLHGQMDHSPVSQATKVKGREPITLNPNDAAARGIKDGDIVRVFNDRGATLAGAVISERVRPEVVQLSTGAWFDPDFTHGKAPEKHGNPNVLTPDRGTSKLAQGPIAHSALVEVERWDAALPPITAFTPPKTR